MIDGQYGKKFFAELNSVVSELPDPISEISDVAKEAAESLAPEKVFQVQDALAKLPHELRERILRDVHARLCSNVEAIWNQLPHARKPDQPH